MHIASLTAIALVLAGCAVASEPAPASTPADVEPPAQVPVAVPSDNTPPVPFAVKDLPEACVAPRFTAAGTLVTDGVTGLAWIATDIAYEDTTPAITPDGACAVEGAGFRAATSAEVIALGQAIPGCALPELFHAVYAWVTFAGYAGPLPITTADGCVDVKVGASYAGDCHVWGQRVSRSALCVK